MRLWHRRLIPYLPYRQLVDLWIDCDKISKLVRNIGEYGILGDAVIREVIDYPVEEFLGYCKLVSDELEKRGYKMDIMKLHNQMCSPVTFWNMKVNSETPLFRDWHNDQYLVQCFYILQEQYDRGEISTEDWTSIQAFMNLTGLLPHDDAV